MRTRPSPLRSPRPSFRVPALGASLIALVAACGGGPDAPSELADLVAAVERDSSTLVADDRQEFVSVSEVRLDRLHRIVELVAARSGAQAVEDLRALHDEVAVQLLELAGEAPDDWKTVRESILASLNELQTGALELAASGS